MKFTPEDGLKLLNIMGFSLEEPLKEKFKAEYQDYYNISSGEPVSPLFNFISTTGFAYSLVSFPENHSLADSFEVEFISRINSSGLANLLKKGLSLDEISKKIRLIEQNYHLN